MSLRGHLVVHVCQILLLWPMLSALLPTCNDVSSPGAFCLLCHTAHAGPAPGCVAGEMQAHRNEDPRNVVVVSSPILASVRSGEVGPMRVLGVDIDPSQLPGVRIMCTSPLWVCTSGSRKLADRWSSKVASKQFARLVFPDSSTRLIDRKVAKHEASDIKKTRDRPESNDGGGGCWSPSNRATFPLSRRASTVSKP